MVLSLKSCTPIQTPENYHPYSGDPQKRYPDFWATPMTPVVKDMVIREKLSDNQSSEGPVQPQGLLAQLREAERCGFLGLNMVSIWGLPKN